MIIHDSENKAPIDSVWAFLSQDKDGKEGIMGFQTKMGWAPLIFADEKLIRAIEPIAEMMAKQTKKRVVLVKFTHRELVKELS